MLRKIIKINEEKCNGCGLCAQACHEGAIGMVNNKAVLLRDDYCDGLGDCLPVCPTNAISFENREAAEYDKEAVEQIMKKAGVHFGGCPGSNQKVIIREQAPVKKQAESNGDRTSKLRQWPLQIKLVNPAAGFLQGADLLIAADCTAYAYGNFHDKCIDGKVTLIGCPKLDEGDYADKLTEILTLNEINSVTVVRMEVPCCGGIVNAVKTALQNSGKIIPWSIVTITTDGQIL